MITFKLLYSDNVKVETRLQMEQPEDYIFKAPNEEIILVDSAQVAIEYTQHGRNISISCRPVDNTPLFCFIRDHQQRRDSVIYKNN